MANPSILAAFERMWQHVVALVATKDSVSFTRSLSSGTKVGTITINGSNTDIYAPTSSGGSSYSHPTFTAVTGKPTSNQTPSFGGTATVSQITSNSEGHVTGATDRTITIPSTLSNGSSTAGLIKTSSNVTNASGYTASPVINGVPYYKDTDTHYTSKNVVGSSTATNNTTSSLTNGNVYLNSVENGSVTSSHKISGSGGTTVTTDSSGNIVITSSTSSGGSSYTHPTTSARTGVPTANQSPSFGGTFTVNQVSNDTSGHVSAITSRTITIPSTLANGANTAGLIKTSSTVTSTSGLTACPVINGVPYYKESTSTGNLSDYMTKANPTGTGYLSLNRKASTTAAEYSVAVGYNNTATGRASFAEGEGTTASSQSAHSEGYNTTASSYYAHAEGNETTASNRAAHSEGAYTVAKGQQSHAEGFYTVAASTNQHVQGKYNIEDADGVYAHIVGNGSSSAPSNAHTVDWEGNGWFAGDVSGSSMTIGDAVLSYDSTNSCLVISFN